MDIKKIVSYGFVLLLGQSLQSFSWPWEKKIPDTPQAKVESLQRKQVDNPLDPNINYDLGVVLYRDGKFKQAQDCFQRTLEHAAKMPELIKRSYFNLGNSCYQEAKSLLGKDWEKQKLQGEVLVPAKVKTEAAIEAYKNYLVQENNSERGTKNRKVAEALLKKIEKKLQELQKDKQDQKDKQQDKQDPQKDKQDKQDQKQQDKQDKQDQNKQDQDKQGQQDKQQQQDQKEDQEQKDKSQGDQEKQDQQDKKQQDKQDQQEKSQEEQDKQDQQDKKKQQQTQEEQAGDEQDKKEQEQQAHQKQADERTKRQMQVALDNLDKQDKESQEKFAKKKMQVRDGSGKFGQKAW